MRLGLPALQPGKAPAWEQWIVTAWLTMNAVDFAGAGPLRYLLTLVFVALGLLMWRHVVANTARGAIVLLVPILALVSAAWSPVPGQSLYFGVLMIAGVLISIVMAMRLDRRQFMMAILVPMAVLCLLSLLTGTATKTGVAGEMADLGVFEHKNVLGKRMDLLLLTGLAIAVDGGFSRLRRLFAAALLPPAGYLVVGSSSVTAILLGLGLVTMVLGLVLVWWPARRVRGLRALLVVGAIAAVAAGALAASCMPNVNLAQEVLQATGKNETLTGRTEIWTVGDRVIAQRPWLGTGAAAFWRPGVDEARVLLQRFRVPDGSTFYFHSAYYEVAVHLGLVGLAAFVVTLLWVAFVVVRDWLRHGDPPSVFLLGLVTFVLLRSATESELFARLSLNPMLMWTAVFLALSKTSQLSFAPSTIHVRTRSMA